MEILDIKKYIRTLDTVVGCTINCNYCYARINNNRFPVTKDFSVPELVEKRLKRINTKTPNVYLMTSASDFSDWKKEWKERVFGLMRQNPQHVYLFLTKRPETVEYSMDMKNIWIGVTVTNKNDKNRIDVMKKKNKNSNYFITFEPLQEDIGDLNLKDIDWIVIGTETGRRKNKITANSKWIENIVNQAKALNIPIFMKSTLLDIVGEEKLVQNFPSIFLEKFKSKKEKR